MSRLQSFLIFFSVFLSIYFSLHAYVFIHGLWVLPAVPWIRLAYALVFWCLASAYIAGRFVERWSMGSVYRGLDVAGAYWLAFFEYFVLACLATDLARVALWAFHARPVPASLRLVFAACICAAIAAVVGWGARNARRPVVRTLQLRVKAGPGLAGQGLRLAVVSDMHIGTLVDPAWVHHIADVIMEQKPDLVLLVGDTLDGDLGPVLKGNLGEGLKRLKAPLGVYACMGNHEHIAGGELSRRYLEDLGVPVLVDEGRLIGGKVFLAGREDMSAPRFAGGQRKPLAEVLANRPDGLPVVLMDHQPGALREAVEQGVALQVSGHTHRGQLWPNHWITGRVYELDFGHRQFGATQVYVSCGVGTWGPPVRVGNRPEVVVCDLVYEAD